MLLAKLPFLYPLLLYWSCQDPSPGSLPGLASVRTALSAPVRHRSCAIRVAGYFHVYACHQVGTELLLGFPRICCCSIKTHTDSVNNKPATLWSPFYGRGAAVGKAPAGVRNWASRHQELDLVLQSRSSVPTTLRGSSNPILQMGRWGLKEVL